MKVTRLECGGISIEGKTAVWTMPAGTPNATGLFSLESRLLWEFSERHLAEAAGYDMVRGTPRRQRAVEALLAMGWTWQDGEWQKPAAPRERCATCDGRGVIGGLLPVGGGYDIDPCPDCGPAHRQS